MMLYLSGPMSGYEDNNFPAFNAAAAALRARGLRIVNPAEIQPDHPMPAEPSTAVEWKAFYNACMRADIKALCDCQGIALLHGWEHSNGAQLELHIAHRLGLRVFFVKDLLETPLENLPTDRTGPSQNHDRGGSPGGS